ncbi:MAG: hypothetical protein WCD42_13555 [Rhizomicrobium sp.]
MRGRSVPRLIATLLLATGCLASLIAEWPGTYVYDSYLQLMEGRAGVYSFWHPPVMSWLLGLADHVLTGAALFILVQTLVGFGALIVLVWLPRRTSWWAVPVAALVCLLPQLLLYQGYVLKDVLLANAALAGFAALGLAAARWRTIWRWPLLLICGAFMVLTILARQNGVLYLFFAAAALGGVAVQYGASRRVAAVTGLCFFVLFAAGARLANNAFARHHDGTPATATQFRILQAYDITGMIAHHPEYPLDVLKAQNPAMENAVRVGVKLYNPARNDTLVADAAYSAALDATPYDVMARQWRLLVTEHPIAWTRQRTEVFSWLFAPQHIDECHPYYVGARGPADALRQLGLQERMDGRDWTLFSIGAWLSHTPVFWHPLYGLIVVLCLWFCLVRRRPADLAMAGYLAGSLVFSASFFAISIACDYRYLYALDLSAIAGLLYLAAGGFRRIE